MNLFSNATDSPLLAGEGLGVRSIAGQFLRAAAVSTENMVELMNLTMRQIKAMMFAAGINKTTNANSIMLNKD